MNFLFSLTADGFDERRPTAACRDGPGMEQPPGHDEVELTEPSHLLPICLVADKCTIPGSVSVMRVSTNSTDCSGEGVLLSPPRSSNTARRGCTPTCCIQISSSYPITYHEESFFSSESKNRVAEKEQAVKIPYLFSFPRLPCPARICRCLTIPFYRFFFENE